ncbi:MAG: Rpn family recombination-promoting nuclease/putative transposase, partial [Methanobrevibacter sp.]|nr:Rpn family recombination-promoting nuclease/putative transposase [Methanobrevibacter sp.]
MKKYYDELCSDNIERFSYLKNYNFALEKIGIGNPITKVKEIHPMHNGLFKRVFACQGCEIQNLALINSVLKDSTPKGEKFTPVKNITVQESVEFPPQVIGGKTYILDTQTTGIKQIESGMEDSPVIINIESQIRNHKCINDRFILYNDIALANSLQESEDYCKIPQVMQMNLLDFIKNKEFPQYHSTAHVTFDHEKLYYSVKKEYHDVEFKKLFIQEKIDLNNELHCLGLFLNPSTSRDQIDEICKKHRGVNMAKQQLDLSLQDPKALQDMYAARMNEM